MALILTSDMTMTDPAPETPILRRTLISDSFSGGDAATILGRTVDAFAGGTAAVWAGIDDGTGAALAISDGVARRPNMATGTRVWQAFLPAPTPDYEVEFTLVALPTVSGPSIGVRRSFPTGTSGYIAQFLTDGRVSIQRALAGSTTLKVLAVGVAPVPGDTVTFGVQGSVLYFLRNGAVLFATEDTAISDAGHVGFSGSGTSSTFAVDNLVIRSARPVAPTQ